MSTADISLDKWQEEIKDYDGNFLLCTGRQVGKTTIMAIKAARYMVNHPKSNIIIVSLTEDQAKLIIIMTLDFLEKNYRNLIARGKDKPTQNKIQLTNGSTALARPVGNTGDAVRGFTGNVLIIDEAARMPELVWESAKPVLLTTAGQIWICSTPHGKAGYFWETFKRNVENADRFKVWKISSVEVIEKRPISKVWTEERRLQSIKFLNDEKAEMSDLQFGQEYLGLFLEDLRQYFSDAIIEKCCILKRPQPPIPKDDNVMGADLARMGGDEIVYSIIHKYSPTNFHQMENIVKSRQFTTKTEQDIVELCNFWNCEKVGIDAGSGSLGCGIFDRLKSIDDIRRKVIAMNNREISLDREGKHRQKILKEDMYDNLLAMMEKGEILFLDDPDIRLSFKSVQWEISEHGIATKTHIFGSYTHTVEALVRCAYIAKKEKLNKLWITSI